MESDIGPILGGWEYAPGELSVRRVEGGSGGKKIQIRMDLGLMQLEWSGRPDAARPHGYASLLDYYREKLQEWEAEHGPGSYSLSREDCWDLAQEAMKYYWRRISFFELKEYQRAEEDARHNLGILDMCYDYAENDEDRQLAEQYRVFVTAHRVQARALACLDDDEHGAAIAEIRLGIGEIEAFLQKIGQLDELGECPELLFLREWESEVESTRPLSPHERLTAELEAAVEADKFELAASLRDRLRSLETEQSSKEL
jgi:hypothetical protein